MVSLISSICITIELIWADIRNVIDLLYVLLKIQKKKKKGFIVPSHVIAFYSITETLNNISPLDKCVCTISMQQNWYMLLLLNRIIMHESKISSQLNGFLQVHYLDPELYSFYQYKRHC